LESRPSSLPPPQQNDGQIAVGGYHGRGMGFDEEYSGKRAYFAIDPSAVSLER
jgi:hypothetical protein